MINAEYITQYTGWSKKYDYMTQFCQIIGFVIHFIKFWQVRLFSWWPIRHILKYFF